MNYYFSLAGVLFIYMSLWFVVSCVKKRNDVADIAWGIGFMLLAWASFALSGHPSARGVLVNTLVSVWGTRLAFHIYSRNKGKTEDYRYLAWRAEWGRWFYLRSYLQVYLLQGFFLFLISLPVLLVNKGSAPLLGWLDVAGILVWLVGFCFELVGDVQLSQFVHNPANKGKVMQTGLWAYTRHPNYFGEVTLWWGIWLLSLSFPNNWVTVIGPSTITFLILKVSGIPLLEAKMRKNPEFAEYARRVSIFIPLPPRKIARRPV